LDPVCERVVDRGGDDSWLAFSAFGDCQHGGERAAEELADYAYATDVLGAADTSDCTLREKVLLHPVVSCEHIVHWRRIWVGSAQAIVHLSYGIWQSGAEIRSIRDVVLCIAKQWPSGQE
jgi:hypothetical protein